MAHPSLPQESALLLAAKKLGADIGLAGQVSAALGRGRDQPLLTAAQRDTLAVCEFLVAQVPLHPPAWPLHGWLAGLVGSLRALVCGPCCGRCCCCC